MPGQGLGSVARYSEAFRVRAKESGSRFGWFFSDSDSEFHSSIGLKRGFRVACLEQLFFSHADRSQLQAPFNLGDQAALQVVLRGG